MENKKGWICLDIDGTVTADPHSIPHVVVEYFTELHRNGWQFVFITGRTFSFAHSVLSALPFPYYFAVQNGADLFSMPEKKLFRKCYLSSSIMERLDVLYDDRKEDFLIYSGWEKGDFCYFRPHHFSADMTHHLELMMTLVEEPWQPLTSFDPLKGESFPLIKCLGSQEHMREIEDIMALWPEVCSSSIKDPLSKEGYYVNLITAKGATKGDIISFLRERAMPGALFIAAGDDRNDMSLLQAADIAIAMENAPDDVKKLSDIIARNAKEYGIIEGLNAAIQKKPTSR